MAFPLPAPPLTPLLLWLPAPQPWTYVTAEGQVGVLLQVDSTFVVGPPGRPDVPAAMRVS